MFMTSYTGERAIDEYMDYLEECDREYRELWKEAFDDKLWLKDPKLFIKIFGKDNFINRFDNKGEQKLAEIFANKYLLEATVLEKADYEQSKEINESLDKKPKLITDEDFDSIEVPF